MKYLKIVLGVIGGIFLLPTIVVIVGLASYIITVIFNLLLFKLLADILLWIAIIIIFCIFAFCGYFITVDVLERNFKFFNKKEKLDK